MSDVKILCRHCNKLFGYPRIRLSQYWHRDVSISCMYCKIRNVIQVNESLMSGKVEKKIDDIPSGLGETIIINRNAVNNQSPIDFRLAKIQVISSEHHDAQDLELREGINIIGRYTEGDKQNKFKRYILTEDNRMSRSHCQILVEKKTDGSFKYILSDMQSLNKTFIYLQELVKNIENGEKIVVEPGVTIGLGYRSKVKLVVGD
jgi:hypothetical protein